MSDQLIQFLGSLAAILAVGALAWWLKLGPQARIADEAEARRAAHEAVDGFDPVAIAVDAAGAGALLADKTGRILLLRPHGTHLAGRLLSPSASAHSEQGTLTVVTGEKRFGDARLTVPDPQAWVQRIEAIG